MDLRVSFDARMVGIPGIGRCITGLWRGLEDIGVDVVGLWPGNGVRHWLGEHHSGPAGPHVVMRSRPFLPLEQVTVPATLHRIRPDVHHATHFNVPYAARTPIVLTIYDLIIYREPRMARSRAAGAYYRAALPLAARRAHIIVALSPYTARQIAETFGISEDRLRVVEAGLDRDKWQPAPSETVACARARFGLPRDYLLYVGSAKQHKNLATLVRALGPHTPPLVLAGPTVEELAAAGIDTAVDDRSRMIVLGRVADDALPALYSGARALVLPSLHEGLGLTPLEAMACGTPVVVSDGGALSDTVGDAGIVVPARDIDAWRGALERIVSDDMLHHRLARAGTARVARRDWRECARQYRDVYREAASA